MSCLWSRVCGIAALACFGNGCLLMGFETEDCADARSEPRWMAVEDLSLEVSPSDSRIAYRVEVTITPEGAASAGADLLRTYSRLHLRAAPTAITDVQIDQLGVSRSDGSDVVLGPTADVRPEPYSEVSLDRLMNDCDGTSCSRAFRAWVDVSALRTTGGTLAVWAWVETPYTAESCDDDLRNWIASDVERVSWSAGP